MQKPHIQCLLVGIISCLYFLMHFCIFLFSFELLHIFLILMYHHFYESLLWTIHITATDDHITSVLFANVQTSSELHMPSSPSELTRICQSQLEEYFARTRKIFDLPLLQSWTDFQEMVRAALHTIPYWETRSYATFATQLWRADAVRAVAAAVGQNSIDIIIPCHRVLWSWGSLTWYNGGIARKRSLLQLEQESIFT